MAATWPRPGRDMAATWPRPSRDLTATWPRHGCESVWQVAVADSAALASASLQSLGFAQHAALGRALAGALRLVGGLLSGASAAGARAVAVGAYGIGALQAVAAAAAERRFEMLAAKSAEAEELDAVRPPPLEPHW